MLHRVGHNHTFIGIYSVYTIFGREITIHTVIYGVYIRFWPAQSMYLTGRAMLQGKPEAKLQLARNI